MRRPWVCVRAKDLISLTEKIEKVAARTTPCIKDPKPSSDSASQDLVEELDVDLTELFLKVSHEVSRTLNSATASSTGFICSEAIPLYQPIESPGRIAGRRSSQN
jgi:hypothetical protein